MINIFLFIFFNISSVYIVNKVKVFEFSSCITLVVNIFVM